MLFYSGRFIKCKEPANFGKKLFGSRNKNNNTSSLGVSGRTPFIQRVITSYFTGEGHSLGFCDEINNKINDVLNPLSIVRQMYHERWLQQPEVATNRSSQICAGSSGSTTSNFILSANCTDSHEKPVEKDSLNFDTSSSDITALEVIQRFNVNCPVCTISVPVNLINSHLDTCLIP